MDPANDRLWFPAFGGLSTKAGVKVDEISALNYSAVWRACRILTETTAGLPLFLYETDGSDDRKFSNDPIQELLRYQPNPDMSAGVWRERNTLHQLNWHGAFNEIEYNRFGDPSSGVAALWPIHPARVRRNLDLGSMQEFPYLVTNNDGRVAMIGASEMLHMCGTMSDDGIWGRGIVSQAREDIGGGKATDMHGHAYFGSGAQPKGILITPGLKQEDDRRAFRREWKEIHGSPDSSEVAIVPVGSSYAPITVSNADNQFLETRVFGRKVIMHDWYGLPLSMCGESVAHGTVEQAGMEFVIYTLYPWVRRQEEQYNFKLIPRDQRGRKHFEHVFASLLRGDIMARMNAYRVAIMIGVMTINECRRLENLNSIGESGDQHFVPANMTTAERAMSGDMGNGGTPGSDHTGAPADNPNDQPLGSEAAFDGWSRKQGRVVQAELKRQIKALEQALPDRKIEYVATAKAVLTSAFGWILAKEANAAQRAANNKSGDFEQWLRDFYGKHEAFVAEAVAPACMTLKLAGVVELAVPANLAAWMRARSVEELRAAFNRDTKETFAGRLAAWPTERVERLVGEVFACGGPGSGVPGPCPGEGEGDSGGGGNQREVSDEEQAEWDAVEAEREKEDEPRIEGRQKEDQDIEDSRELEDEKISEKRDAEDEKEQAKRDGEDDAMVIARGKEDESIKAERDTEDKEIEAANNDESGDAALSSSALREIEKQRDKEDRELERRDKEDSVTEKQREKQDDVLNKKRAKDDDARDAEREKEDAAIQKKRDKEDAEREAKWEKQHQDKKP